MSTDLDELIIDCRAAVGEDRPQAVLREVLRRAVSRPAELMEALLPATRQQSVVVHVADDLTILQVVNAPGFTLHPHNHGLWSAYAFVNGQILVLAGGQQKSSPLGVFRAWSSGVLLFVIGLRACGSCRLR